MLSNARTKNSKSAMKTDTIIEPNDHNAQEVERLM
jgi:hypothetical protein